MFIWCYSSLPGHERSNLGGSTSSLSGSRSSLFERVGSFKQAAKKKFKSLKRSLSLDRLKLVLLIVLCMFICQTSVIHLPQLLCCKTSIGIVIRILLSHYFSKVFCYWIFYDAGLLGSTINTAVLSFALWTYPVCCFQ